MELDHIVYCTASSPEQSILRAKSIGFPAVRGGVHEDWGTQNTLAYLRNAYIEWLSVRDLATAQASAHPLIRLLLHELENGGGFGTVCFRSANLEALRARLLAEGRRVGKIVPASRMTEGGKLRRWRMLLIEEEPSSLLPMPFFIQWEEGDDERATALEAEGALTVQGKAMRVASCTFSCAAPQAVAAEWAQLLDVPAEGSALKVAGVRLQFIQSARPELPERMICAEIEEGDATMKWNGKG